MDELVGAPSLDDAWAAFARGDVATCAQQLAARLDALHRSLGAAPVRVASRWTPDLASVVDEAFHLGLLACKVGALATATRAQRDVLLATWSVAEAADIPRWFQAGASCELAYLELHRNRGTVGLARLRSLRQQLIDAELRDLLAEADEVEQPAIELVDGAIEYLESALRMGDHEAVRPSYDAESEPPADPSRPPSDPVPPAGGAPRGAWPRPLEGVEAAPTLRDGLEQLGELNHETWRHIYDGREAARADRHEASLDAFDRAIQAAELVAGTFRGSWEARRVLAVAIVGRSGALEQLEIAGRSRDDAALATGILSDLAVAYPEVVELLTDEAWAASVESWRACRLGRPDAEVLERSRFAIERLDRARTTAVREPDDLLSLIWLLGHAGRHYRRTHAYGAATAGLLRGHRVASEMVHNYYDQARDYSNEALEQTPGRLGALVRWLMRQLDRRIAPSAAR